MRKNLLIFNLVFFFGLSISGLGAQNMYLSETNGMQTTHQLTSIKKISFSSGNLILSNTSGLNDSYSLNQMRNINFKDLTLGVENLSNKFQKLFLYPNPATDVLNVSILLQSNVNTRFEIISIDGRVLQQQILKTNDQLYHFNVSGLPYGLYFFKISNDTTVQIAKFMKK